MTIKPVKQIIHDPTRGWLLLLEKWPERFDVANGDALFTQAVAHCLSTAVEIQKENWDAMLDTNQFFDQVEVNDGKYQYSKIQDHHPYTVDAEFEVVRQYRVTVNSLHGPWIDYQGSIPVDSKFSTCDYRQIARLVKAKEVRPPFPDRPTIGQLTKPPVKPKEKAEPCALDYYQIRNGQCKHGETGGHNGDVICDVCKPTDSVTSDGITPMKSPRGQCNCTPEEQHGETSVMCCNRCGKPTEDFWSKPTESQDELWDDALKAFADDHIEAKKRFRIERI